MADFGVWIEEEERKDILEGGLVDMRGVDFLMGGSFEASTLFSYKVYIFYSYLGDGGSFSLRAFFAFVSY